VNRVQHSAPWAEGKRSIRGWGSGSGWADFRFLIAVDVDQHDAQDRDDRQNEETAHFDTSLYGVDSSPGAKGRALGLEYRL
jgi:hypothetical protein